MRTGRRLLKIRVESEEVTRTSQRVANHPPITEAAIITIKSRSSSSTPTLKTSATPPSYNHVACFVICNRQQFSRDSRQGKNDSQCRYSLHSFLQLPQPGSICPRSLTFIEPSLLNRRGREKKYMKKENPLYAISVRRQELNSTQKSEFETLIRINSSKEPLMEGRLSQISSGNKAFFGLIEFFRKPSSQNPLTMLQR